MTVYGQIYLDSNVLIDLAENQEDIGATLQQIVASHPTQRHHPLFLTSELTFSEVLVKPYRDHRTALAQYYLQVSVGSYWLQVDQVSFAILERAAALRAVFRTLKLPDAIHMATAQLNGCSHFLTNDLALSSVLATNHPTKREKMVAVASIRADPDTLTRILKDLS